MDIFKRTAFCVLVSASLLACGDGGDDSSSTPNNSTEIGGNSETSVTDYTNPNVYPISSTVRFRSHSTGDVFKLSDGSAWKITGTSNSSRNTGIITSNVTISTTKVTTPDPVYGIRSGYYLVGSGIAPAFFVEPLLITPKVTDTTKFRSHSTGDVFKLSDGSAWKITGTSNSSYSTGTITSNVTVYSPATNAPDPVDGIKSEYYLIGDGLNPAFFIKQLSMQPTITDTVTFSNHTVGDIFLTSNGSSWKIVGTSNSSYSTGTLMSRVIIYSSTFEAPDPDFGERSEYYLIGEGINPAFFIIPI